MTESCWLVYRWQEGGVLVFDRRLFIKHELGEQVTSNMVRDAMAAEAHDFRPAKYRAVPEDRMVDLELVGRVVLS